MKWVRETFGLLFTRLGSFMLRWEDTERYRGTLFQVETNNEHMLVAAENEAECRQIVRDKIGKAEGYCAIRRLDPILNLNLVGDDGSSTTMPCFKWAEKLGPGVVSYERR